MSDWKNVIDSKFKDHAARRSEIQTALTGLLSELKQMPDIRTASITGQEDYPLAWAMEINGKEVEFDSQELAGYQTVFDDEYGHPLEETRPITEALQDLLVNKYNSV